MQLIKWQYRLLFLIGCLLSKHFKTNTVNKEIHCVSWHLLTSWVAPMVHKTLRLAYETHRTNRNSPVVSTDCISSSTGGRVQLSCRESSRSEMTDIAAAASGVAAAAAAAPAPANTSSSLAPYSGMEFVMLLARSPVQYALNGITYNLIQHMAVDSNYAASCRTSPQMPLSRADYFQHKNFWTYGSAFKSKPTLVCFV